MVDKLIDLKYKKTIMCLLIILNLLMLIEFYLVSDVSWGIFWVASNSYKEMYIFSFMFFILAYVVYKILNSNYNIHMIEVTKEFLLTEFMGLSLYTLLFYIVMLIVYGVYYFYGFN